MPSPEISSLIAAFEAGATAPARWAAGLSQQQLLASPIPGTWSMQTLILHMLESDLAATHRMRRVVAEDMPLLIAYDETLASKRLAYDLADAAQAADLFRATRAFTAAWLRTVPDADFTRAGIHNQRGKVSLLDLLRIYIDHVSHHEKFALAKRRALGL
jgi:uncharacterized damage-inducible protein DinB